MKIFRTETRKSLLL